MVDILCAAPLDDLGSTVPFQIAIVLFIVNTLGQIEDDLVIEIKAFSACKVLHSVQVFSHA